MRAASRSIRRFTSPGKMDGCQHQQADDAENREARLEEIVERDPQDEPVLIEGLAGAEPYRKRRQLRKPTVAMNVTKIEVIARAPGRRTAS